ncbi:hypothetical protein C8R43DRAFT_984506 [Mycena crocata]|nr:hypothetical protein C8R43DRAFT_984506 [Mycena crocata]
MPALIPVDELLGAGLIGLVLSTIIYGITWLQVFSYYTKYSSRDGPFLKTFVGVLMVLDTFHVALLVMLMYHYTVTNFGDYLVLMHNTWPLVWQAFVGGVLEVSVEMFFAYRLYHLSGRQIVFPIVVGILCLAKLATTIGFTVIGLEISTFSLAGQLETWSIASLSTAIGCDTVIAVSLIYYLRKSNTGFKGTHRAINLLITYALNTCLLTSIFNIVCMTMWIKENTTMIYATFYFILVRLYSCSFMSTLNGRESVRKELEGHDVVTMSHLGFSPSDQTNHGTMGTLKLGTGPSDRSTAGWGDHSTKE